MPAINFSPFPVLNTPRLVLRQVRPEDVHEIFFLRSDDRILKFLSKAPAKSTEEVSLFIQKLHELENMNDGITWGIQLKEDKKLIGTICYWG